MYAFAVVFKPFNIIIKINIKVSTGLWLIYLCCCSATAATACDAVVVEEFFSCFLFTGKIPQQKCSEKWFKYANINNAVL